MKGFIAAALGFSVFLNGCVSSRYSADLQEYERLKLQCTSSTPPKLSKFTDNSSLSMDYTASSGACYPVERGVYQGVRYEIDYHRDEASFYGIDSSVAWLVRCKTDAITDRKSASIIKDTILVYRGSGSDLIGIAAKKYPGTESIIRVDDRAPDIVEESVPSFKGASKAIEKIKNGKKILLRYTEWPSGRTVDSAYDTYGFNQAYHYSDRCL